ncbi:MAG: DUF4292 domain-containing protein [Flavobacteriales bacterium]|nr:DUF4292 domain-containing protein [Flavobacteriales bacterium]
MRLKIFVCVWIFAMACKVRQEAVPRAEIRDITPAVLFALLDSAACRTPFFSARFSAQIKIKGQPESQVKGKIRWHSDSLLWCSIVPALGIEVARLLASPGKAELIHYFNREFYTGNYRYFSDFADFPLSFSTLMAMACPTPVFLHPKEIYKLYVRGGNYFLCPLDYKSLDRLISEKQTTPILPELNYVQALWIDPATLLATRMLLYDVKNKRLLEVRRAEKSLVSVSGCALFTEQDLRLQSDTSWVHLKWEYLKPEFPAELDFPFQVPENYTVKELR